MRAVIAALAGVLLSLSLSGCANPNYIGIQNYGYIVGNVVDQTGKPISNAFVYATGTTQTAHTGPDGGFNIQNVAVGEQTVTAQAAGYQPQGSPVTVIVTQNAGVQAGNIVLATATPAT
jgi:TolB protein